MRILLLVFMLIGLFSILEVQGQNSLTDKIKRYEKLERPDSLYFLFDSYEKKFKENKQWDSLVFILQKRCGAYFRFEGFEKVQENIKSTEEIAIKHLKEEDFIYLNFLQFKARILVNMGAYVEGESLYDQIIDIASKSGNDSGIIETVKANKAFLYVQIGKTEEAESLASSIYDEIVQKADTGEIINVLQSLTLSNRLLGNIDKAIEYNDISLSLSINEYGSMHQNTGIFHEQTASLYLDKGQAKKALKHYNKSKEIQEYIVQNNGSSRFLSTTIANLGVFYSDIGEHRLSIDHLEHGMELDIKDYGEDSWNNMWYYQALAIAYTDYGDYDKAEYYIDKAIVLLRKNEEATELDNILLLRSKASALFARENFKEALPIALKVYAFFKKNKSLGTKYNRVNIINLISNIYIGLEDNKNAYKWARIRQSFHKEEIHPLNSLRVSVFSEYLPLLTRNRDSLEAYRVKDELLKLRNRGNSIYTLSNAIPDHELLNFAANWVDFLYQMSIHNDKYRDDYFEFIEDFEKYYSNHLAIVKTNSNLAANESYLKIIFSPAIHFFHNENQEEALLYVEKCKSFSTKQILQNQLIDDPHLPTMDYSYDFEISDDENVSLDFFFKISSSIDSISNYKDSLFTNNKITYEKYFGLKDQSISNIRELLGQDELMIEFFKHDSLMYAFYIDKDSLQSHSFSYPLVDSLAFEVLNSSNRKAGENLRELLFPDNIIGDFKKLKILPDGILNAISFSQLHYLGRPMIYEKIISYGLSAAVLQYQKKLVNNQNNEKFFLGLTPGFTKALKSKMKSTHSNTDSGFYYLLQQPFLLALSESLSRNFSGEIYQELEATEHVFKSKAQDFQILHLATHGVLEDNSPLFSRLIFAKDSIEDGYLHAYELYGKNLNAELAVLSACSSGKQKSYASEGIVSLSHAFTHAGCPSVLMTRWDVDEKSTSAILKYFYENLEEGMLKSEALREAKLTFLSNSSAELQDPYYWAGLILIGDDSAMFSDATFSMFTISLLSVMVVILLLYLFWRFNRK